MRVIEVDSFPKARGAVALLQEWGYESAHFNMGAVYRVYTAADADTCRRLPTWIRRGSVSYTMTDIDETLSEDLVD